MELAQRGQLLYLDLECPAGRTIAMVQRQEAKHLKLGYGPLMNALDFWL